MFFFVRVLFVCCVSEGMSARPSLYLANVVRVRVHFWSVVSDGHAVYRVTSTLDPAVCFLFSSQLSCPSSRAL